MYIRFTQSYLVQSLSNKTATHCRDLNVCFEVPGIRGIIGLFLFRKTCLACSQLTFFVSLPKSTTALLWQIQRWKGRRQRILRNQQKMLERELVISRGVVADSDRTYKRKSKKCKKTKNKNKHRVLVICKTQWIWQPIVWVISEKLFTATLA